MINWSESDRVVYRAAATPLLISVVTVVFNDLDGIRRTCASLQHLAVSAEWIVIDGGSTDGTAEWLRMEKYPWLRYVSEGDKGIYDAMNKGWQMARGEWVYFLNSGDTLRSGLTCVLAVDPGVDVVSGRVELEDSGGNSLGRMHPPSGAVRDDLLSSNCVAHQATLLRRHLIDRYGAYSLAFRIQGDFEYWARLMRAGARFHFIDDVLAGFAYNGVSSQRKNFLRAEYERIAVLRHHGYLGPWQAAWRGLRTALLYHIKSVLLAVMPTMLVRRLRRIKTDP